MAERVATYSICACDLEAGQWGVATQSKFLAVGSVVPWAEPHVGAVATQAYANPGYGPRGLALLRDGLSAEEAVERLTSADEGRAHRQLGIVDAEGRAATYTGDGVPRLGRRARRCRLRRAGEHPRVGRDGRRAGRDVRGVRREAARRAAGRFPRRGGGGGRRQPRAPVRGPPRRRARRRVREPLGRPRRPPGRRPPRPARRAEAHLPHCTTRCSAPPRATSGSLSTTPSAPSWTTSCGASAIPTSRRGPASRTSRSVSTAMRRSTRSCWNGCGRRRERPLRRRQARRARPL